MPKEGYCQCGCGEITNLARQTDSGRGFVKNQPLKYLTCSSCDRYITRCPECEEQEMGRCLIDGIAYAPDSVCRHHP